MNIKQQSNICFQDCICMYCFFPYEDQQETLMQAVLQNPIKTATTDLILEHLHSSQIEQKKLKIPVNTHPYSI